MKDTLKKWLSYLDEAIEYEEQSGLPSIRNYIYLRRQRRVISKAVRKLERLEHAQTVDAAWEA